MNDPRRSSTPRRLALAAFAALALSAPASFGQDAWARVRAAGVLRWGSDAEGGAPYQFHDPRDLGRVIGFEVEIVDALAAALDVRAERVQNNWGELIQGLDRGDYDIAVSGIEIVEYRLAAAEFSRPYYACGEALVSRRDDASIRSLDDCDGKKVATLRESVAHRLLQARPAIEARVFDDQLGPYLDLELGRVDAVLLDEPIALYYGVPRPALHAVGAPIGEVRYGIAVKKGEKALVGAIDNALAKVGKDGTLRSILERWNLWNAKTADLLGDATPRASKAVAYDEFLGATGGRDWSGYFRMLGEGAIVTVERTVLGMALAIVLGLTLALVRLYAPKALSLAALAYIEVVRGTPLLIQLLLLYYGLGQAGVRLPAFVAGVLGLGLNYAAAEAENYRSGLQAVARGQWEAAAMLGLTRMQTLRFVVVPQAVRIVIPSVTNDFIAMFKDSSIVSVIALEELTKRYQELAPISGDYLLLGLVAATIYLALGAVVALGSRLLEKKLRVGETAGAPA